MSDRQSPPWLAWHAADEPDAVAAAREAGVARVTWRLGRAPAALEAPPAGGARTRLDLMWWDGRLGVRGPTGHGGRFEFHAIDRFRIAAPEIQEAAARFRHSAPPFPMAQVRFRVAPDGATGLWIDVGRADIEALFESAAWLAAMREVFEVLELGQRGEAALLVDGAVRCATAPPRTWLPSFDGSGQSIPLVSTVAGFSQPGPAANRALLDSLRAMLTPRVRGAAWVEFGAGYGNLGAGLRDLLGAGGTMIENDRRASALLRRNADAWIPGARCLECSAVRALDEIGDRPADLWLLDPPRPGFGPELARAAGAPSGPRLVAACHCHDRGLAADASGLQAAGFRLVEWRAIDLFPGSAHLEVVSLWER